MDAQQLEKKDRLAADVLRLSRNTLLVNLRFMDMALNQFRYLTGEDVTFMTDGEHLLYGPNHILKCYRQEKEVPVRDFLHIVLHCVYRHMYVDPTLEHTLWDLSCDIAVENVITELGLKATSAAREKQQSDVLTKFKNEIKLLTAEKIYAFLKDKNLSAAETADLRGLFYADDHRIWYMTLAEIEVEFGVSLSAERSLSAAGVENGSDGENDSGSGSNSENDGGGSSDNSSGDGSNSDTGRSSRAAMAQVWRDISERMQQDLETFSKQHGDRAGSMMQNLAAVNREKYDYTVFLKKFAVMGEAMKINDDEFDYVYYTYGLKLYDKMPLIEPLEYKEVKRIREFVIAIDTSGSTSGELVQKFVQKTYNILKSTESFFTKINLHIIQCDADIQEHIKITSQEEFDEYLKNMQIHGLGGTDFRPVFTEVDKLVKNGEFSNLKGLIYFTDGYGNFPAKKPDYQTAFVFMEDEYNNPNVPPWAIKLILQTDEI